MKREDFRTILELSILQPWIVDRSERLDHLLFNDCITSDKQNLIIELIKKFVYLSNAEFISCLKTLSEDIATEPILKDTDTQIVAMAADSSSDSSHLILYQLKIYFEELGWQNHKLVSTHGKAYGTYKKSPQHKNLVLIDEFVGSGNTVIGRVAQIQRQFKDAGITDYSIKVKVIISTEIGLLNAQKAGIEIEAQIILKKGITDSFPHHDVKDKIKLMLELESLLSDQYNDNDMPSLGYGSTESLYLRDEGNTPNSVFPIFWWPFYKDYSKRITLLTRAMSDA